MNAYIPYCHFRMEGLQNLKYMLQKLDYMCKLDLKDAHILVPLDKKGNSFASIGQKTCTSSFALALFWARTMNIYKIVKSVNDNLTQDKHQNNNLLKRHAID